MAKVALISLDAVLMWAEESKRVLPNFERRQRAQLDLQPAEERLDCSHHPPIDPSAAKEIGLLK